MKIETLAFANITSLKNEEMFSLYKKYVTSPVEDFKTARETVASCVKTGGKVTAALKRLYVQLLASGGLAKDTTEKAFFAENAGGTPPARILAVATLFNAIVLTNGTDGKPLLPEAYYDAASGNALEQFAAVVSHERKQDANKWMESANVKEGLEALSRPGDAISVIKAIRKRQKGTAEKADAETAKATLKEAVKIIAQAIQNAHTLPEQETAELFVATYYTFADLWQANKEITSAMFDKWNENHQAGVALTMEVKRETVPVETTVPALAAAA